VCGSQIWAVNLEEWTVSRRQSAQPANFKLQQLHVKDFSVLTKMLYWQLNKLRT